MAEVECVVRGAAPGDSRSVDDGSAGREAMVVDDERANRESSVACCRERAAVADSSRLENVESEASGIE